jgi:hypothetical protein
VKGNIYKDNKGSGLMRKSFCAYLDILGFSEKVVSNDIKYFNKYLSVLEKELKYVDKRHELSAFELKIFTDNFVFGHPWYDEYGEVELANIFDVLAHIQFNFLLSDIFIRGAVSMSELYMDENIVLGPAIIDAYKLETEKAVYPRIILSNEVIEVVKGHTRYYSEPKDSPQNREYLIDIDGHYFINYLYIVIEGNYDYDEDVERELLKHKKVVTRNIDLHRDNFKLHEKYIWIGRYHNYFCETFLKRFKKIDMHEIRIEENILNRRIGRIV